MKSGNSVLFLFLASGLAASGCSQPADGPPGPRGDVGATGPSGPAGPPGPSTGPAGGVLAGSFPAPTFAPGVMSVASYAQAERSTSIAKVATELVKLSDADAGGALVLTRSARLVLNGAVTIGNGASTGISSQVDCSFQISADGGEFAKVGVTQSAESRGNSNHDERDAVPLTAVVDRTAGTYDIRIVCNDEAGSASSQPRARAAAFSVIAIPDA